MLWDKPFSVKHVLCCTQALAPQKVDREAYDGPVIELATKVEEVTVCESAPPSVANDGIIHRPPTRGGGRNMQESSFSFSGKLLTDRSCSWKFEWLITCGKL